MTLYQRTMTTCDGCYRHIPSSMVRPVEGLALCPDCHTLYTLDCLLPSRGGFGLDRIARAIVGRVIA